MDVSEIVIRILALFGAGVLLAFLVASLALLKDFVSDQIVMAKYRYKRKHRFDKDPIAKCYCIDCIYYMSESEVCRRLGKYMIDNDFCSYAEPHKHDPK